MDNAGQHPLQTFLPWKFDDHQHHHHHSHGGFSFFNLHTTRRLLQIVPTPAPSPVNTRNCCCRGAFCCCDAPGAPCCNILVDNGISTQRYIFGILALLVIVFVTVFYVCIAWRFVRRRRRTRAIAMEAALEEQRRQKELLELVERACSVPSNVILAQQKASVVSVTSSKLETTSSCSSAQSADEVVMPGAKSSKLYLSQECPVCLEDVADVEAWRAFRCGHGICYTCLATAVKHATSALDIKCPICREHVLDVPQEQEAGGSGDGALQGGAQVQVGDDVQSSPVVGGGIPEVVDGGIPEAGSSEAVVGGVGNASPQGVTHDAPPRANV